MLSTYTNRRHRYDGLGRVADSALTTYTSLPEPVPAYRDHLYAGARHIGNVIPAGLSDAIYGARWHWAGAQQDHTSPLFSPNADTAGQKGYNIAQAQSPHAMLPPCGGLPTPLHLPQRDPLRLSLSAAPGRRTLA